MVVCFLIFEILCYIREKQFKRLPMYEEQEIENVDQGYVFWSEMLSARIGHLFMCDESSSDE